MPRGRALSPAAEIETARGQPALSVVVVIASDTTRPRADVDALTRCLDAFGRQAGAPEFELIVPYHDAVDGIETLKRQFPHVAFLPVDGPKAPSWTGDRVHHHTLRTRGLLAARGELLALVEDHACPAEEWCANLVAAHGEASHAAIGGPIDNAIDRPLNWAVYFCDFARYQSPLPEGESSFVSDINVAYKRGALDAIREIWAAGFYEVIVNDALTARGETLWLRRDVVMWQRREGLRIGPALGERFAWGQSYAGIRSTTLPRSRRGIFALLSPLLPLVLTTRIGATAARRGHLGRFVVALPLLVLLEVAWSLGECAGYLRGRPAGSG